MAPEIIVALLSAIGSLAGVLVSNKLTIYRIKQLEIKVEKHNNLVERMALVEMSTKSAHKRMDELSAEIK